MERNDTGWKLFTFGMNDENGRLIEIKMPAKDEAEAIRNVKFTPPTPQTIRKIVSGLMM